MGRVSITVVSAEELESVWATNKMPEKRAAALLLERIVYQTSAGDPRYLGGVSNIIKLFTPNGQHIGTLHEVVLADGTIPHSHPKDYTRRDCSRIRLASRDEK